MKLGASAGIKLIRYCLNPIAMQKFLLFLCVFLSPRMLFCQYTDLRTTQHEVDSILRKFDEVRDFNGRFETLLSIYSTAVEVNPVLIFETGQKLYAIAQKNKDILAETAAWSFYGQSYRLTASYVKALECHHKAIALAEKSGYNSLLSIAQNQMAHIYKDREEFDKAIRLYQLSKKNALLGTNKQLILWPMMNLGAVFLATNQLDSSLYYSRQVIEQSTTFNFARNLPYVISNIAGAYSKLGNQAEAEKNFRLAVQLSAESKTPRYQYFTFLGLAEHFQKYNQVDSAVFYSKKAIEAVQFTPFSYLSLKPAKLLTDRYESINADSTIKYLKIYRAADDSLYNTRANQQLQMMTFEEEQRQQAITTERINYENKIRTYALLAGLVLISLIGFILFRNNRQKQKANNVLQQQKAEIESTLSKLRSTQAQLVQSEKMASLGELTAGIAHEIQNPLNFVNNFAELNQELLAELQVEINAGNLPEANSLAADIITNEGKINFHGKRADAIVKSMLQHSQPSSSVKEPVDLNKLSEEYIRLALLGQQARDKSFQGTVQTDFDPSIPLVNVIPQDIGRVILNILSNAFHVASQVTVTTRKQEDKVLIHVADNGPGIPEKNLGKIFQPFFTTKPTGEGTGLGLSLAYDIVKAHGGNISVDSTEGKGSTFIISLPTN